MEKGDVMLRHGQELWSPSAGTLRFGDLVTFTSTAPVRQDHQDPRLRLNAWIIRQEVMCLNWELFSLGPVWMTIFQEDVSYSSGAHNKTWYVEP